MYNVDYQYLRPKKGAALKAWHEERFDLRTDLAVWTGKNACIQPVRRIDGDPYLFGRGGVVDENGQYVPLSALPDRVTNCYPCENAPYKDEKVVYCGYLVNHWGHFLVEAVARLWYFLENDSTIDKYVFVLKEHGKREIKGNYREFFQLLKVWDKLEFICESTVYREVVVPELSFQFRDYYSKQYLDVFDVVVSNVVPQPDWEVYDKIFFTRTQLQKGQQYQCGFEAVDNFYQRNGYQIIAPEKISLSRMIHLIHNCQIVAAVSGTLPHNLLFGKDGQKLVVLERCIPNNDCQVNVNRMRHLDVTYIDANIGLYNVGMIGPFIMGYTHLLQKYAEANNMVPPSQEYCTEAYRDKCFKKYMRSYQDEYRYHWHMAVWHHEIIEYVVEAYREAEGYFEKYLNGSEPFLPEHYFQFHYFKQFVKKILRKLKLMN